MKRIRVAALSLFTFVSLIPSGFAQVDAKLTGAVKHAKVSLDAGLKASEREGKPISGKFELEDRKLQLSIYWRNQASSTKWSSTIPLERLPRQKRSAVAMT